MLLAIDVGNTHVVVGAFDGARLLKTWRVSTHPRRTGDELRAQLRALFEDSGLELEGFHHAVVSSVVPFVTEALHEAFDARFSRAHVDCHFIDHRSPFAFKIAATPASQVGADRLVNAEAAVRDYGSPALVLDSGTATTLCAVSRAGEYLGGAIMPGIDLSMEALTRRAAKLFSVELTPPERAIGHDTEHALRSGILLGYASMIDGMVARFKAELGEPDAPVVATGGVSQRLRGLAASIQHFDPDLTLRGIRYLYETIRSR